MSTASVDVTCHGRVRHRERVERRSQSVPERVKLNLEKNHGPTPAPAAQTAAVPATQTTHPIPRGLSYMYAPGRAQAIKGVAMGGRAYHATAISTCSASEAPPTHNITHNVHTVALNGLTILMLDPSQQVCTLHA
jgi:hypothetical protein